MQMFNKFRLALLNNDILKAFRDSDFRRNNIDRPKEELTIDDIDHDEKWCQLSRKFVERLGRIREYREMFDEYEILPKHLYYTIVYGALETFPNPIYKTGPQTQTFTFAPTGMFIEGRSQMIKYIPTIRPQSEQPLEESARFFIRILKQAHDYNYGELTLEEI